VNPPDSELSGSVKCEEFSDQLRNCQLSSRSLLLLLLLLLLLCGEFRAIASPPSHDVDQAVCVFSPRILLFKCSIEPFRLHIAHFSFPALCCVTLGSQLLQHIPKHYYWYLNATLFCDPSKNCRI